MLPQDEKKNKVANFLEKLCIIPRKFLELTYIPNLHARVGDLTECIITCLRGEVGGADEFPNFVCVNWKKNVFVRFWELQFPPEAAVEGAIG